MSYRDLPAGRERMLAYAREVDIRNRASDMTTSEAIANVLTGIRRTHSPFRMSQDIVFGSIRASRSRVERMNNLQISPFYEYELLSELPSVKVGLISNDLIKKSKIDTSKGMSFCSICQQDIYLDIIRKLDCTHHFHVDCIDKWFVENKKCPQCRFEI
jgi:hypothetical protein